MDEAEARLAAAEDRPTPMSRDHELLYELGTQGSKWAGACLQVLKTNIDFQFRVTTDADVNFELESILTTWFANAIEVGRDAGQGEDRDVDDGEKVDGFTENIGERAIRLLGECADALEAMPPGMRTVALGGLLGNHPLNNPDSMRQEAKEILIRMDAAAAATREV